MAQTRTETELLHWPLALLVLTCLFEGSTIPIYSGLTESVGARASLPCVTGDSLLSNTFC